jgi:hypothetical protein
VTEDSADSGAAMADAAAGRQTGAAAAGGVVICAGATKAGTSWFYRTLQEHPRFYLRTVKEVHYWNTFDPAVLSWQLGDLKRQRLDFVARRAEAEASGNHWKWRNLKQRVVDIRELEAMLAAPREDDSRYLEWLTAGAEGRISADVTPAYATVPEHILARAVAVVPGVKFVFLMRDPVSRLWSHVRMNAFRSLAPGEDLAEKANGMLERLLRQGDETRVLVRGDYPVLVGKLRRAVPASQLHVEYCERLFRPEGQADMAAFLGIEALGGNAEKPAHEGPKVDIRDSLRGMILEAMRDHYAWAEREVGPLPAEWQARLTGKAA